MLSQTRQGHPKLFLNTERLSVLTQDSTGDAFLYELIQSVLMEADRMLDLKPAQFIMTGPRMLKQSQLILHRISTLALAFNISNRQELLDRVKNELWNAAHFPHWNPSHFLDTAELCTAFAIGYDWLFPVLSADERLFIKQSLVEKGITCGLEAYREKAWWIEVPTNWNLVCNGGLLIAALAVAEEEPDLAGSVIAQAIQHLPTALQGYAPDGGWDAGPEYWDYSTWYTVLILDAVRTAMKEAVIQLNTPGLEKAGLFPLYCCGPCGRYFNFADSDDHCKAMPALFWLGNTYHLDACIQFNHQLLRQQLDRNEPMDPFNLIWYQPPVKPVSPIPVNAFFAGTEVVFMRNRWNDMNATFLAFKGGNNQADHAHLDLGSFVLDTLGHRWIFDLGKDDYDLPGYWDMKENGGRWLYFRLNNFSHNTLILNNDVQRAQAKARIIQVHFSEYRSFAVIDLSEAYRPHAESVKRGFMILEPDVIMVQDEIELSTDARNIQWQVLTDAYINLIGENAVLTKNGRSLFMRLLKPDGGVFQIKSTAEKSEEMPQPGFQMLVIEFSPKQRSVSICVFFSLQQRQIAFKPLQDW